MVFSGKLGTLGIAALGIIALAACSSGGGSSAAPPSWAKGLGSGVTVTSGNASADDGSPGGVVLGVVAADQAGDYTKLCSYYPPAEQADCKSSTAKKPASQLKSELPTYKNVVVTYTAVKGTEGLVGVTGTVCDTGSKCVTNNDPAAILDSGKPFATLWSQANAVNSTDYSLATVTKVDGKWCVYTGSD